MDASTPLLSVVATSRNDDHGANLKRRMQTFVNAFINQCKRHDFHAELILVEWNPPADRPQLAQALQWPADPSPCEVRIIEVPECIHRRFKNADRLPLFQMIGKNVGIRRARGEFVLATNIDILFSDELMRFFKSGQLRRGVMYRIDRTDVETNVPQDASVEEQLAYCQTNMLRIYAIDGSHRVTPTGARMLDDIDVAKRDSGISLDEGWYMVEKDEREHYRCAGEWPRFRLHRRPGTPARLLLEVAAPPWAAGQPVELQLLDAADNCVASGELAGRCTVSFRVPLAEGEQGAFRFAVRGGVRLAEGINRPLSFAVYRMGWAVGPDAVPPREQDEPFLLHTFRNRPDGDIATPHSGIRFGTGWYDLDRDAGGPFRWARSGAELVVEAAGHATRWLRLQIGPGPGVRYQPFTLEVRDLKRRLVATAWVRRADQVIAVRLPLDSSCRSRFHLHAIGGGLLTADDPRILDFRVTACSWGRVGAVKRLAREAWDSVARPVGVVARSRLLRGVRAVVRRLLRRAPEANPVVALPSAAVAPAPVYALPFIHAYACGDFTLLARDDWFALQGYAELEMYSAHIDTLGCLAAHYAGLREEVLQRPMRAYHIEHSLGSGVTPEGQDLLFARLAARGVPFLTDADIVEMAQVLSERGPRAYATDDWGLASEALPETRIGT